MPAGAVYVGRPTRWGNPYIVGQVGNIRRWTGYFVGEHGNDAASHGDYSSKEEATARAVELYRLHTGPDGDYELDAGEVRQALSGRDLVCWCPLGQPCHADVLLEFANTAAATQ
jgi:hypothetical protein